MFYIDCIYLQLKRREALVLKQKINSAVGKFVWTSFIAGKLAVYLSFPSPKL